MAWPTIPATIFTDSTAWQKVTSWTKGKVADRQPVYGTVSLPIACSVSPTSAQMVDVHGGPFAGMWLLTVLFLWFVSGGKPGDA